MKKSNFLPALCAAALLAVVPACSSYDDDARDMRENWSLGNFAEAERIAAENVADASEEDELVWQLDHASTLRACGRRKEASEAFELAAGTLQKWDDEAEILLSKEALASLTNLSALPYRGRSSDAVMLHTYRALTFLELGKNDSARVALNAAFRAQRDAVARHEEEIERAREEAAENAVSADRLASDAEISAKLAEQRREISDIRVLADYVNPFTTWLYGIYFLHAGTDGSDLERADKALERVAKMYPENKFVKKDLLLCKKASAAGTSDKNLTYVIFESGTAPTLGIFRIDTMIPIPLGNGRWTPAPVSIALPKLVVSDRRRYWGVFPFAAGTYSDGRPRMEPAPALSVDGIYAEEICDMDSVVRTDFENSFDAILTRTLVTAFVKSAASAAANAAALEYSRRDNSAGASIVALATIVGTSAYTYASSGADVRCWQTLPRNFSVARLETPKSRQLTVRVGERSRKVELVPARVNLVIVKSTDSRGPLVISQAALKE